MIKLDFNDGWRVRKLGSNEWKDVSLPHDAMIEEPRSRRSKGGANTGYYEEYDYEYEKTFTLPKEFENKKITLEFEGVYHNAEVYLNDEKIGFRPYGYTNFYVSLFNLLKGENTLKVIVRGADQPNTRWYSGAGIYRPVWLYAADKKHILINGLSVKTLSVAPAVIEVKVKANAGGTAKLSVQKDGQVLASSSVELDRHGEGKTTLEILGAKSWNVDMPCLYTLKAEFFSDEQSVSFGVRTIACDAKNGFMLNGERVVLRGACIHHDNGILGARCFKEAEERKVLLLKECGYNAIRSAHNPCSKYLLDACDKFGMLVMDEYVDEWYVHKTMFGYANYLSNWWKKDLKDMVEKDYNHPSVVMYSLGNEVGETSERRGVELVKAFSNHLRSMDDTRPVTCGINLWFNAMYSMGFGQYSDEKARKALKAHTEKERKKQAVGSEFFNTLAGKFGAGFMKTMATLPVADKYTKDAFKNLDVAGYNYGIKRYKHDLKKYPDRVIVGTETFCSDAYSFWELAKNSPALIGDFVWSGMDYLGEVGVGAWEYKEYAPDFSGSVGWVSAGSGRLDLTGNPLGEALYTKVAFELEDKPRIAVVPVSHTNEKHSPSAWKFSNAIPSWSWEGNEGQKAKVEVYSRAPVVKLYINNEPVGEKKFKKNCKFDFTVTYQSGFIEAVAEDEHGNVLANSTLRTASADTVLSVLPEKREVKRGEVCFVRLKYTDLAGIVKPLKRGRISVAVTGGELLALGSACPYSELPFTGNRTDTYYGEALAVVRVSGGNCVVSATDGVLSAIATITVLQ